MDERVAAVVEHWAARFVANDLDSLDVQRTLDAVETWDDWADAWEAAAARYEQLADDAEAAGHACTAAQHRRRASLTLQFAQFVLNDDPGSRERLHARQCGLYRAAAPDLRPPAVPYERTAGGSRVHGYVRRPARIDGPAPVVVLVPGLESTKEQFSTYEPYFLDRGVATVSIEGPGQGEARRSAPFTLQAYRQAFAGVLDWLPTLDGLDATRLAVVGTSFGGFLALRCTADAAAGRVSGVVDIAGPHTLPSVRDLQPVLREGFVHLVGADADDEADARLADVTLAGLLDDWTVPTLVVHGDADGVIPVEHGDRIATEIGSAATFDRVPGGSHSCNNLHTVVRPRVADWVADRLEKRNAT